MTGLIKQIAIIGQACRFPGGAHSPQAFWNLLLAGTDAVTTVPQDRFDQSRFLHPDPGQKGRTYTFAAGTIGDVAGFDAGFFGISAREAQQMDPQQRLLLELTYEAFERAGQVPAKLAGSDCAVYVGVSSSDYGERRMGDLETMDPYFMLGATFSIVANRISYVFDLRGPSMAIDTACSSSLVALHEAVHALQGGRCGMAVVGGVNLLLSPAPFVGFSKAMMLAKDGRCRAFGKGGEGYVRSEGGGVVILKALADAERDGDPILAVIRGVGVNTDGRTHGIALPSSSSQLALLRQVYREARVSPRAVSYFEAHGTGTAVGDPAEANAIGTAIGKRRPKSRPLLIGSAKSNIGHLEPAAGMAGLIKSMAILRHGVVPPSLHIEELNPDIAFDALNLQPVREATPMPQTDGRRIVGVNSFGFGGTNAHVVLEAYAPPAALESRVVDRALPLVLSARSETALNEMVGAFQARLASAGSADWHDIAYSSACRRSHLEHRLILHAASLQEARDKLAACQEARPHNTALARGAKVGLVFVGNGAQWVGMGTRLLAEDPVFRDAVAHIDSVARWRLGWSVMQTLQSRDVAMDDTSIAQPLLFTLQVALVEALKARGLVFDGTVGHSVGEIAAAHIAGALSLEQAVRIIRERSEAQARTRGHGRMMVAALGEEAARAELDALDGAVELAAINSPRSVTLSGRSDAVHALEEDLRRRGIPAKMLELDYAFHSSLQDPTQEKLLAALGEWKPRSGELDFYSTVSGGKLDGAALDADYWWHNVRWPVRFLDAVTQMEKDGYRIFLEIGPAALLQGNLRHSLKHGRPLPSLTRDDNGIAALERTLDSAYLLGADIDFGKLFPEGGKVVDLPAYPWQRERHWYEPTSEAGVALTTRRDAPLLGMRVAPHVTAWDNLLDIGSLPFLAGHQVDGAAIVPAAAFVEMALEAGEILFGNETLEIEGMDIQRPLVLDTPRTARFTYTANGGFFRIESREHMRKSQWTTHVTGRLASLSHMPEPAARAVPGEGAVTVARADHYAFTDARGFGYGPDFQVLEQARADAHAASAMLALPNGAGPYRLHPALLDGLLQAIFPLLQQRAEGANDDAFVPHKIGRIFFRPRAVAADHASAEVALTGSSGRSVLATGILQDDDGSVICELQNIRLARVSFHGASAPAAALFETVMEPLAPLDNPVVPPEPVAAACRALAGAAGQDDGIAMLDDLAACFAADALLGLGHDQEVPASGQGLLARLIAMLERHPDAVGDPDDSWRQALAAHPTLVAELTLLGRAGRRLPAQLQGGAGAPSVSAMREQLFDGAPLFAVAHHALADAVTRFAAAWPAGRRLRVVELGAGAGGFSRMLLAALPESGSDILLVDTDPKALAGLEGRFAAHRNVEVAALEALEGQVFDLVISAHGAPPQARLTAAPGAMLLTAQPRTGAWTSLVLGIDQAVAPGEAWRPAESVAVGGMLLTAAVAADTGMALPSAPVQAQMQDWLVLGDGADNKLAEDLAAALALLGHHAVLQDSAAPLDAAAPRNLIYLSGLVASGSVSSGLEAQARRCDGVLALLKAAQIEKLVLVTRNALPLRDGDATDPAAAALIGLGRVLQNERPELNCRMIDLRGESHAIALAAEIAGATGEPEMALAGDGRFAPRLRKAPALQTVLAADEREVLQSPGGSLDHLAWSRMPRPALGDDDVEIAVTAAGLNFRDVMFALGVLPDEILEGGFAGATLGMEAAGTVTRLGAGVTGLAVGDAVVCFAPASLSTHLVTRKFAVAKLPAGMDFDAGATLIAAFFTVTYALSHLARLGKGERILIHGAAGGVGIAAVQYARHVGAEIFATAGSDEKRDFLKLYGLDEAHVLDSRSSDFAAQVRNLTGGAGVDVVLNSLAGEAVHRGLSLLKPFGRFIELGKVDFVQNSRIGLRVFRNNITYHGVDADQLMAARPDLAEAVFRETIDLFAGGAYIPLPHRVFPRAEVVEAFRHMQRSRHIGKIVIQPQPAAVPAPAPRTVTVDPQATYLVTGGLAGLGLASAGWLASHGARHLVLASRSGVPGRDDLAVIDSLRDSGVTLDLRACDVTDAAAVAELVAEFAASLKGIIHAAAVYDDVMAADLTPARLRAVLAPKAGGALVLDAATRELKLDLFLMYSSISAVIGNVGQANYVAANLVLESLAARRRSEGRAAQLVALGPVADAGHLTVREGLAASFTKLGMRPLAVSEVFARLDQVVLAGAPGMLVADVKWSKLRGALPVLRTAKFRNLTKRAGEREEIAGDTDFAALAAILGPEELLEMLLAQVSQAIGQILHVSADKIDREVPVFELGMDSLMGLELRMAIEEKFRVEISSMSLSQDASVRRIAEMILGQLTGTETAEPVRQAEPTAESEQAHILSRHAENFDPDMIAEAMESLEGERPRLLTHD